MKSLFTALILVVSLGIPSSQAEIPFTQARGVYEGTKDEYKDISPFWGMVAINGMLEQIRFFGNYEEVKRKKPKKPGQVQDGEQEPEYEIVDQGRDPIAKLIQWLFPSPDGVQFVANTRQNDPVGGLSRNLGKINILIEILLNKETRRNKITQIKNLLHDEGNDSDVTAFATLVVSAYNTQDSFANPKKNPNKYLYPENIVIISLLGFFAKVADSSEDFKRLTVLMKDDFEPSSPFTKDDYDAALKNTAQIQDSPELAFLMAKGYDFFENPFMKPIQYRGDTCFKTYQGFPDCGETSLRNIFMMLLGKQGVITPEALENLKHKIDPIDGVNLDDPNIPFQKFITFFEEHPFLADATTRQSHDAWAEVVSDLNRQEERGTLQAVQYGRGSTEEQKEIQIYEIKANFSNMGVNGMINMLNVIAKIIPDKQLNEPWAADNQERFKQAAKKFTRFCELLSRDDQQASWENRETRYPTIESPFPTITLSINGRPAYDWRFMEKHFQIFPYASNPYDWRVKYQDNSLPNEWLAYFYTKLNETKLIEDESYSVRQPLTFIYNPNLRSLDGALQAISFVLYNNMISDQFKQFMPLIGRWIETSIPLNDAHAVQKISELFYGPTRQGNTIITDMLAKPQFAPIQLKITKLHQEDPYDYVKKMIEKSHQPPIVMLLTAKSFGKQQELNFVVRSTTTTDAILKKIAELTNLTSLKLPSSSIITDAGLQNLTNLTSLDLSFNDKITDAGLQNLPNLTSLILYGNEKITNAGLQNLSNLKSLDLGINDKITDAGLQNLPNLTSLGLSYNDKITDDFIRSHPQINVTGR